MRNINNITKKSNGSVLVELAIVTPIALILLLFIYWLFLSLTWKQALKESAIKGVDLAQTRGDPVQMGNSNPSGTLSSGRNILPPIERYLSGTAWGTAPLGTVSSPGLLANHQAAPETTYNKFLTSTFVHKGNTLYAGWAGGINIDDFNSQTLYAMAYAYENMKVKVGPFIKYPCDFSDNNDLVPSCAICVPAGPSLLGVTDPADATLFGIQCFLQPMDNVLTPLLRLLGINSQYKMIFDSSAVDETQEGYNN